MSWFGGSGAFSLFKEAEEDAPKEELPVAKKMAKPTALRDWELEAISAERHAEAAETSGTRPKWDPFLSLEDSVVYEEKFKRIRQMRDVGNVSDIMPLRSYEQQVLGLQPLRENKQVAAARGDTAVDDDSAGMGKAIPGTEVPINIAWALWPHRITKWTPEERTDEGALLVPNEESSCQGVAYFLQGKTYEYYEAGCEIELYRNDEVFGRSPGAAGLCFHVHVAKNTGLYGYVFYLRFSPGDVQHGELVLAKLGPDDSAYDAPEDVVILSPKTAITQGCVVKVVDEGQKALKGHRGLVMEVYESWGTTYLKLKMKDGSVKKVNADHVVQQVPVSDGFHYFRVRSFRGALMFYFNFGFVGYYEVEKDFSSRLGHIGIWSYDLEVRVKRVVIQSLEEMDAHEAEDQLAEFQKFAMAKVRPMIMKTDRMIQQDAFLLWAKLSKNERDDRLAPLLMLEGEARASERKAILTKWISTLYTLQRYAEILNSPEHLRGPRVQKYLMQLDVTDPPPPPPPLAPPPSEQDSELHYLYAMQQKRYQVQIEEAGRRVLGPEKFAQLKNMAGGSLAQRQKDLVAQRQIEMAEESNDERQYQALNQMAQRLRTNFGEMDDLVPTMRKLRGVERVQE